MATKITRDIIESFLNCNFKGHLKLAGESGTQSDYETMTTGVRKSSREQAIAGLVARFGEGDAGRRTTVTAEILRLGTPLLADVDLEDEGLSLRCDALKRVDGASQVGDHYYVPVLHNDGDQVGRRHKLLLAAFGLALARVQGLRPTVGLVASGPEARLGKVRLDPNLYRRAELVLGELGRLQAGGQPPRLTLNGHCQQCEFRQQCHTQATKDDDLSLLRGMSEQEISRQNSKGIFTVRQLSYTFRVRRRNRRAKSQVFPRSFALQALAIRENKVHVHGNYAVPSLPTSVYLDIEGRPDRGSYYLIGLVVVEGGVESRHSFWADSEEEQPAIFARLLEKLAQYPEYHLFHFGNYEPKALRRITVRLPEDQQKQVEVVLRRAVNVLSIINAHVYFPTYSCGLKDIGQSIGCGWSEPDASGLQSVIWRTAWERNRDESQKVKLVRYNMEDCLALKAVVEFLARIAPGGTAGGPSDPTSPEVVRTEDSQGHAGRRHRFGKKQSTLPGFDYLNKCAYFDHQRDKVFVRTNPRLRGVNQRRRRARRLALPINKVVELACKRCLSCNSRKLFQIGGITQQIIDLRYFRDGVKRWVTKYVSWHYSCTRCGVVFAHPDFPPVSTKYGRGLVSWCIYQNIVGGQNLHRVRKVLAEVFKISLPPCQLYRFKTAVADYYQPNYARILEEMLKGSILHIDETEVDLRGRKGYVWVLTSMERVYFFYRDSREGTFLKEMLRGFAGVLVSDFYTAYDSLDCPQQKCLIHLLRDLNEDVLKSPYDEEFKTLAQGFSTLLRKVVETIDRYGLKKRHLHKHRAEVEAFFDAACSGEGVSEVARGYRKRFEKYRVKLFAFLDHDGVPWNNNNAEHAIKCFAKYREFADGRFTEASLKDYLVILSVYQSCEYQGIDFLDFLRGKDQKDTGGFGSGRRKPPIMDGMQSHPEQLTLDSEPPAGGDPAAPMGSPDDPCSLHA
jgi:predicted RecB family nuclease